MFDDAVEAFVSSIRISPEYIDTLMTLVHKEFDNQLVNIHNDAVTIDIRITELRSQIRRAVDKIKFLSSEATIKYMEEDIVKLEAEINELLVQRQDAEPQKPTDIDKTTAIVKYYLEHLNELLLHHSNPVLQANILDLFSMKRQHLTTSFREPLILQK